MIMRLTPTGYGKSGPPPRQLGSTEAVLNALPHTNAVLLVATLEEAREARELWPKLGRCCQPLIVKLTSAGPLSLWATPPYATIGVGLNAFAGIPSAMYEEMQQILASGRFAGVIWA